MKRERVIDRFDTYMKHKDLNDNQVTVQLGFSVGLLGKSRKEGRDLSRQAIDKITAHFKDLNKSWLMTGEGPMVKEYGSYTPHAGMVSMLAEKERSYIPYECKIDRILEWLNEHDKHLKELRKLLKEYLEKERTCI